MRGGVARQRYHVPQGRLLRAGRELGRLRIVSAPPEALERVSGTLFRVRDPGALEPATDAQVLQGYLEEADVNPVTAMTELVTVQRTFDALHQAVRTYREMDERSTRRMS